MSSPGWYPDPQDARFQQFYDGQRWTGERRPAAPGQTAQQPPYVPPEPYVPPAPTQHLPAVQAGPYPTANPYQAPPPAQQFPARQPFVQNMPYPAGQGYQPAQQGYPQPGWGPPAPAPRRSRKRLPLIIGVVVVLVAGLVTGGFLVFGGGDSPKFTYNGKTIDNPAAVLNQTSTTVASLVNTRHGASDQDTRCYYAVPAAPPKGTKKTDVDQSLWCGPVLFVDGSTDKQYLRFTLSSTPTGSKVTLTAATTPTDKDPAAAPSGLTFERPDGASAPSGNGGLSVPAPPAAEKDTLAAADIGSQRAPAAPTTAVIGSINGGVSITSVGSVTRYGAGDDARSAPSGQRLLAFKLGSGYDKDGGRVDLSASAKLSVDGGTGRTIPSASGDQYVIAAVPSGAKAVDVVLDDGGFHQTLSLLTGRPGKDNVTVLARAHRDITLSVARPLTLRTSATVVFSDGATASTENITMRASGAELYYRDQYAKASGPSTAILYIRVNYTSSHSAGVPYGFNPDVLTFTPTGGRPIKARNVNPDPEKITNVFEVPGGLTTGTLTISGSWVQKYSDSSDTYTTTISPPVSIPVRFPAG